MYIRLQKYIPTRNVATLMVAKVTAAEWWVKMTERISAISGSKVTESRSRLEDKLSIDAAFWFVDATFRSGDMRFRVRKSRIANKWSKI